MVEREVLRTEGFERAVKQIKDQSFKKEVIQRIRKIVEEPETGKPLRHTLKGERSIYARKYRIIYTFTSDKIIFLRLRHRKEVYKEG